MSNLVNFVDLTIEQHNLVLSWRNSNRVRNNMYDSNHISQKEHLCFVGDLKQNKKKNYFLFEDLGVIYFTNIHNNSAEIGLYSNPEKFGVGKILMDKILEFPYKKLTLEVFSGNLKAIELYKKYNFIETERFIKNNRKVMCMELDI